MKTLYHPFFMMQMPAYMILHGGILSLLNAHRPRTQQRWRSVRCQRLTLAAGFVGWHSSLA